MIKAKLGRVKNSAIGPIIDRNGQYSTCTKIFWFKLIFGGKNIKILCKLWKRWAKKGKCPDVMQLGVGFYIWKRKENTKSYDFEASRPITVVDLLSRLYQKYIAQGICKVRTDW